MAAAIVLAWAWSAAPAAGQTTLPVTGLVDPEAREADRKAKVEKLVVYFLGQYGQALAGPDWVNRSMAVISLSAIDEPRVTAKLLEVLTTDASKYVRVFAWEALHARAGALTAPQRAQWIEEGLNLAAKADVFNGQLRTGLLLAAASQGPTEPGRAVFRRFFAESNLLYPGDNTVLEALATTLGVWKDRRLTRDLIVAMSNGDACYRAEFVLRGLKPPLKEFEQIQLAATGDLKAEWAKHQKAYAAWFSSEEFANLKPEPAPVYAGRSTLIPEPEAIVDPSSPKWKKYLEVPALHLDQLGVNIVLDTTGSMGPAIEWMKGDVARLMRALRIIAREPTMGVTLYRDRGDAYLVHALPMTGDIVALSKALKGAQARGGGDYPEALYDALHEAILKQNWPRSPNAHKVIVVVSDAPPHRRDMPNIRVLVKAAAEQGFRVHCLKVPGGGYNIAVAAALAAGQEEPLSPDMALDAIAKWGKGESCTVRFVKDAAAEMRPGESPWKSTGGNESDDSPYRLIVGSVVRSILTKEYHEQVDPFVSVLLESMSESPPEKRVYLPAVKPTASNVPAGGGGGGAGGPAAPPKPPAYKQ